MDCDCVSVCLDHSCLPVCLVDLHVAVELLQLLFEQLQVGVDEAELQSDRLLHLVVGSCPADSYTHILTLSRMVFLHAGVPKQCWICINVVSPES